LWSLILLVAPPSATPFLDVQAADGRLTIRAAGMPLFTVLDEVARKTGMEVVFEAQAPRPPITVNIQALPEEEAIAKLLEGQPVSWGVKLSANQRRVERLVVAEPGAAARADQRANKPVPEPDVPDEASHPGARRMTPATPRPSPSPTARPSPSPTPTRRPTPTPSPRP
jgi:hypothetical protein